MLTESLRSFAHLRWRPVVFAVLAEIGSMIALALMERRILMLAGVRLSPGRLIAIAYASNAISASLPVVGSGAATAFSYRRLVTQGATPALAGWALTLAGILSNVAFVVIISIGAIVAGSIAAIAAGAAGLVLSALAVIVAVVAMRRPDSPFFAHLAVEHEGVPAACRSRLFVEAHTVVQDAREADEVDTAGLGRLWMLGAAKVIHLQNAPSALRAVS